MFIGMNKKEKKKESEQSQRIVGTIQCINIYIMEVPDGEENMEKGRKIFE